MRWEQVLLHVDGIARQFEEVRAETGIRHAVFLYDIFVSKRIHELAEMDDPDLDVSKMSGVLNKEF